MKKIFGFMVILIFVCICSLVADEGDYVCDGKNLMQLVDGALVKAGEEVIADDFSKKDTAIWNYKKVNHCWEIKNNSLITTAYGGFLPLIPTVSNGYVLKVKIKPITNDPERKGGFAGVMVNGIMFIVSKTNYKALYKRPGEKNRTGKTKSEKVTFDRWYDFKIVVRPGGVYEWFVDGRKIIDFIEPELKGEISFQSWRVKVAYKDFKVFKIEEEEAKTGK